MKHKRESQTMTAPDGPTVAPRTTLLLPVAYLAHVAEEWFGGFTTWTQSFLGNGVSAERFVVINAVGFILFVAGSLAAVRYRQMAWFGASLAALLGLNGVLHSLATVAFATYSPGTVTGVLLYLPLSVIVLRASAPVLPRHQFIGAIAFGVVLHGLVSIVAFQ